MKLLVISLTLTQMEMSCLFLAATRDSQQWPSHAPGFLNIQLKCGEATYVCESFTLFGVFVCICMNVYVHPNKRRGYRDIANTGIMIPLI